MKILLTINGQEHTFEWTGREVLSCQLDGAPFEAEAAEIAAGVYSLLIGTKSSLVRVTPTHLDGFPAGDSNHYNVQIEGAHYSISIHDMRRWSRARSGIAREGRQQITAPMPGKVVRILVAEAQRVEAGQGVVVVEAMKMQNEIKSHAPGTIEKILVSEGQTVTAGETLLIIE